MDGAQESQLDNLLRKAAEKWDVERLFSAWVRKGHNLSDDTKIRLCCILLGFDAEETLKRLGSKAGESSVNEWNSRYAYGPLLEIANPRVPQELRGNRTKEGVLNRLRQDPRYWRGDPWRRLLGYAQSAPEQKELSIHEAHLARDTIFPEKPRGPNQFKENSTIYYSLSVAGYAVAYLFHESMDGTVTLVRPSHLSPGPRLDKGVTSIRIPPVKGGFNVAGPGTKDTLVAVFFKDSDPLGLEGDDTPRPLSTVDIAGVVESFEYFMTTNPDDYALRVTSYYVTY